MDPDEQTIEQQRKQRRLSIVSQASEAIAGLPKKDITELKSYAKPPTTIKDVLTAAMILLGKKTLDWEDTKKYLADPSLLQRDTLGLDCDSVTSENRTKAMEILSKYSIEKVNNASKAAAAIYDWADAVTKV